MSRHNIACRFPPTHTIHSNVMTVRLDRVKNLYVNFEIALECIYEDERKVVKLPKKTKKNVHDVENLQQSGHRSECLRETPIFRHDEQ